MRVTIGELRGIVSEALTSQNRLALRFLDLYATYDERDFDKAVDAFVTDESMQFVPVADALSGETRMVRRRTRPEDVVAAFARYGGTVPATSRWAMTSHTRAGNLPPAELSRLQPRPYDAEEPEHHVRHEPRSGRRVVADVPSATADHIIRDRYSKR